MLNVDSRSLDALRTQAANNPKAAAHQAAVQFESVFMQMMVKSMRDATPKAQDLSGSGGETFTAMLDSQFASRLAGRPGGLAQMLEQQLTRHLQNLPPVSPENQPQPAPAVTAPAAAAAPATAPASALGKLGSRATQFIREMLPHAKEAERQTGVPASFILGQAALESGWGKGEMKNADGSRSYNLFGVKATPGWKGATTEVMTTEYQSGEAQRQKAAFRSYGSYTEAFADYARMLATSPRYAGVVRGAGSAEAFAGGMQRAGYATDPQYANKLARTINATVALSRALA